MSAKFYIAFPDIFEPTARFSLPFIVPIACFAHLAVNV